MAHPVLQPLLISIWHPELASVWQTLASICLATLACHHLATLAYRHLATLHFATGRVKAFKLADWKLAPPVVKVVREICETQTNKQTNVAENLKSRNF